MNAWIYLRIIWLALTAFTALLGWWGLFPFSWLIGLGVGYLLLSLSDNGLGALIKAMTVLATIPGGAGAAKAMFDIGTDSRIHELKIADLKILEIDRYADVTDIRANCDLLGQKALSESVAHGILAVYLDNPVLGRAASYFIPDIEEDVHKCVMSIISYRDKNPDLFRSLEATWPKMPNELKTGKGINE